MIRVCLFGPDGGGKTTFAKELGVEILSFATPVKEIAHEIVGREPISREDKEKNFRQVYRAVGQRAKELHGENVWADLIQLPDEFVIDDGRFNVELDRMKREGITTVYVNMTGMDDGCEVEPNDCDFVIEDDEDYFDVMRYLCITQSVIDDKDDITPEFSIKDAIIVFIFITGFITLLNILIDFII